MHGLLLAAPVVIVAGLAIVATIEIWHPSGPTENVTVAAALTKHRSRGHTVTEAEVRSAYETKIHHGLSAEIVSICVAGDWNECAEFRSDDLSRPQSQGSIGVRRFFAGVTRIVSSIYRSRRVSRPGQEMPSILQPGALPIVRISLFRLAF